MPLLMSPIDGSPMKQIHRFGIEIDICPTSGGIWLDKGELEKLMALLKEDNMNERPETNRAASRSRYTDENSYIDDDDDSYDHDNSRRNKKSKLSNILDIFDF